MAQTARQENDSPRLLPSGAMVFTSVFLPPIVTSESPARQALFALLGIDGAPARPNSIVLTEEEAARIGALPLVEAQREFSRLFCALPPNGFVSAADRSVWMSQHQWCAAPPPFSSSWIKGVPNLVTGGVAAAVAVTAVYMIMNRSRSNPRNNPRRSRRSRRARS